MCELEVSLFLNIFPPSLINMQILSSERSIYKFIASKSPNSDAIPMHWSIPSAQSLFINHHQVECCGRFCCCKQVWPLFCGFASVEWERTSGSVNKGLSCSPLALCALAESAYKTDLHRGNKMKDPFEGHDVRARSQLYSIDDGAWFANCQRYI